MTTRQVPAAEFKARCLRIIKEMNRDGGAVTITNRGRAGCRVVAGAGVGGDALRIDRIDAGDGGEVRRSLRTGDLAFRLVGLAVILKSADIATRRSN